MDGSGDWFIIVDEEKFSDDLVCDHIKQWLGDRGFDFKVNVIDLDGTIESNRILAMAEEAKERLNGKPIDEILNEY